jgi:transcriptional regulator with XRE-family HTH domain
MQNQSHEAPLETVDLETLGGRMRAARMNKRLSVVETATSIGVSRVSYGQWESGDIEEPSARKLLHFTRLVDVDLYWLLDRQGPDPEDIKHLKRAAKRYRRRPRP